MSIMLAEIYDALKEAKVSDVTARKAAEAVAAYDNRLASLDAKLASIDGKLTATMWLGGIFLVMLAGSQAGLWLELGKLNGGVSQLNTQISHIESRG